MPYSKELKKVIENSNFTHRDIIEKLGEKGLHIDKSYLSKLIHEKLPPPREEISRAIAQICNEDERILVIEGYYDKAPKEIKDVLFYIQKLTIMSALSIYSDIQNVTKKELDLIEAQLKQQSIGEFLVELLDYEKNDDFSIIKGNLSINSINDNISFQLEEPISLKINNDDMFPIVPQNSKITVKLLDKYQNGDVVALNYENEIFARYYFENNGTITLNPIDKKAKVFNGSDKNIKILGKISNVITEIQ